MKRRGNALKARSTVAPEVKSELAVIERDLANAVSLREFLAACVGACEKGCILRTPAGDCFAAWGYENFPQVRQIVIK